MKAIFYSVNPLGWATCKWLSYFWPGCRYSALNGIHFKQVDSPALPADDWVLLRTLLGGICGTDLAIIAQKQLPNSILQAFGSMPMALGHENVAVVEKTGPAVDPSWLGTRVCVEPTLSCLPRGIEPLCPRCRAGEFGACENFADNATGSAHLPPGTSIGYNSRTGGSYGEYFVAHQSQLIPIPENIPDETAILTDPLACSLHAILRSDYQHAQKILVYGAGTLGLAIIALLRSLEYSGQIDTIDRHDYLKKTATDFGADNFLELPESTQQRFEIIADQTDATVQHARFGNYMLSGGYDIVFDCVGATNSINESLKWTRARGQMIMVATGHGGKLDLTPLWFRELDIKGAYGRQLEHYQNRRIGTYQLIHELIAGGKLNVAHLLTHKFPLDQYRRAFDTALNKPKHSAIKVAFDFR